MEKFVITNFRKNQKKKFFVFAFFEKIFFLSFFWKIDKIFQLKKVFFKQKIDFSGRQVPTC
jgi:hypothetical protein